MAEIIDFKEFKIKKTGDTEETGAGSFQADAQAGITIEQQNEENLRLLELLRRKYSGEREVANRITNIFHMTSGSDPDKLKERREIVKKYSTDQIFGWFSEKEAEDWTNNREFFHAIADEVWSRMAIALNILEKKKRDNEK